MNPTDQLASLVPPNCDPRSPSDYISQTPGALRYFTEGVQWLSSWGMIGESLYRAALVGFSNRLSGYTTDSGAALCSEFSLPQDPAIAADKWNLTSERGTKAAVFDSLRDLGHRMVSIYNAQSRVDSPYASSDSRWANVSSSAPPPSGFMSRYSNVRQVISTGSMFYNRWYSVVVWDCMDGGPVNTYGTSMTVLGNFTLGGANLGNSYGNGGNLGYVGEKNQHVIRDCALLGKGIGGMCMEVVLAYPNWGAGGRPSRLNGSTGMPLSSEPDDRDVFECFSPDGPACKNL